MDTETRSWVWVPNKNEVFKKGYIVETVDSDKVKVRFEDGSDETIESNKLGEVNPSKFDKANDIAELTFLNEPSVLHNLERRYKEDLIYTYSGLFLVAINPYSKLSIYSDDYINMYHNVPKADTKPHIFSETESAYQSLLSEKKDQSILVTGESGAGKTENTKKILRYLAAITSKHTPNEQSFEQKIIEANPIIEAFGNSQTVRNNNSSRFGKFIKVEFDIEGKIAGAHIDWYLLEKSRVVNHAKNERSYHIFYQILSGLNDEELNSLGLNKSIDNYNYLKNGNFIIPGVNDKKEFQNLKASLDIMGIAKSKYFEIFKIIAIILHIGNIEFQSMKSDQANFKSSVETLCNLLGVSVVSFSDSILRPKVKAGKERVKQSKNAKQARFALDALSKSLYEKVFKYLVDAINENLNKESQSQNFIGVLDIAGFEIFNDNSFEQLCINYTNEKLQQFFNHHMFVLEQNEYIQEDIEWDFIDFGLDLQQTIDLIEKQAPIGIFSILDEECIVPKSSDESFFDKLNQYCNKKTNRFKPSKFANKFTLKHYAGDVEYSTENWIEKNRDPLSDNILEILASSSTPFIAELYSGNESQRSSSFRTVAQKHKEQLNHLLQLLSETHPHFVRCIIPNPKKKPKSFDKKLVLEQLKCNGVLEGIRIVRSGFPNRIFFKEFYTRYRILTKETDFDRPLKDNCQVILKSLKLDKDNYKVGSTKVFFKAGILAELEMRRDQQLKTILTHFKAICKGVVKRRLIKKDLQKAQASQVIMKAFKVYTKLNQNPWAVLHNNLKPMLESSNQVRRAKESADQLANIEKKLIDSQAENCSLIERHTLKETELKKVIELLETERSAKREALILHENHKLQKKSLEAELEEKISIIHTLNTESSNFQKAQAELEEKVKQYQKDLDSSHESLRTLQNEKSNLIVSLEDSQKSLKIANDNNAKEVSDRKRTHDELILLQQAIKSKELTIKDLKETTAESKKIKETELQELTKTFNSSLEKFKNLQTQNIRTKAELEKSQRLLLETNAILSEKKIELESAIKNGNDNLLKLKALETETSLLRKSEANSSDDLTKIQKEVKQLLTKNRQLEHEALEARQLLERKISDDVAFNRGKPKYDTDIANFKLEIESLKLEISQERSRNYNLARQLKDAKSENDDLVKDRKALDVRTAQGAFRSRSLNSHPDTDLERLRDDKEQLLREYISIKLQLNEKSALLKKEAIDKCKLKADLKTTQTRLASETFDKQQTKIQLDKLRRAVDMKIAPLELDENYSRLNDENKRLQGEVQKLTVDAELSRKASLRASKLYSEETIQKRALRDTNSLDTVISRDLKTYKAKFEASEARSRFLERELKEITRHESHNPNRAVPPHKTKQEHSELLQVYHETSNILSETRRELTSSKSRIIALEQEIVDCKYIIESYKNKGVEALSNQLAREELAKAQVKLEALISKNSDLSKSVKLYKGRSDEYFKQLENSEISIKEAQYSEEFLKRQLQESTESLEKIKSDLKVREREISKLNLSINHLETFKEESQSTISKLESSNRLLKDEIQHYHERLVDNNSADKVRFEKQLNNLNDRLTYSLREETELRKTVGSLEIELDTLRSQKNEEISELRKESVYHFKLSNDLKAENSKVVASQKDLEIKLRSLMKQIGNLNESVDSLIKERDSLQGDKAKLEERIQSISNEYSGFLNQNTSAENAKDELMEKIKTHQDEIESLKSENKKGREYNEKLNSFIDDEKQKNVILLEENQSLGTFNKSLKERIKELEEKLNFNHDEVWVERLSKLETKLQSETNSKLDVMKEYKIMEKNIQHLQQVTENQAKQIAQHTDETSKYQMKISELFGAIQKWQVADSNSKVYLKRAEREINYLKDHSQELEKELEDWQAKFDVLSARKQSRQAEEILI
ncbi:hypothetical protein WICMUC_003903 [Wickerhamomyces mucosus]|uniref:Myosin motor domain-containing protein n=1 Tax=Wickerhamomyces mucosus TaxID=1378264 RepID=A0A9P8TC46_9ASCO|nr:hypothetical protein WICMUC_003903 [Wickerhamomyces mucosus]